MSKLDQFVQSYLTAAKANPGQRFEIFRGAAYDLMNLAQKPGNAKAAARLSEMGLMFARAASDAKPSGATIEDFKDLLQETQQAYQDVGDDPMDLIAQRRQIHDERTQGAAGNVSIAPESFNKDATLGRSQKLKWNPTQNEIEQQGLQQSQTVAFWQGTKKEAQAMTVDISLGYLYTTNGEFLNIGTPQINVRAYAEIEFGSDGNRNKFRCDVGFGKRITVVGNYISVVVGVLQPRDGATTIPIEAGASIGAFAAPSNAPTIYTEYAEDVEAGQSWTVPIPLRATHVLPLQTNLALNETLTLVFREAGTAPIVFNYMQQLRTSWMQPIPIPADAAFFEVRNDVGNAGIRNIRIPFLLSV